MGGPLCSDASAWGFLNVDPLDEPPASRRGATPRTSIPPHYCGLKLGYVPRWYNSSLNLQPLDLGVAYAAMNR